MPGVPARPSPACVALLIALALAPGLGCKKSGNEQTPPPPPSAKSLSHADPRVRPAYETPKGPLDLRAERLCEALHVLPARRRAECCQRPMGVVLSRPCAETLTAALQAKGVTLDAQAVDACAAAMAQAYQGCEWVGPSTPALPRACRGLLVGTLAEGATCRSSLECPQGLRCRGAGPTSAGVCDKPGEPGASCALSVDTLGAFVLDESGERDHPDCSGFCERHRCTAQLSLGAKCGFDAQCGPDRHCAAGTCVQGAWAKAGEPCAGGGCVEGLRCISGRCAVPKASGATCTADAECAGGCVRPDGGASGTCGVRCDVP